MKKVLFGFGSGGRKSSALPSCHWHQFFFLRIRTSKYGYMIGRTFRVGHPTFSDYIKSTNRHSKQHKDYIMKRCILLGLRKKHSKTVARLLEVTQWVNASQSRNREWERKWDGTILRIVTRKLQIWHRNRKRNEMSYKYRNENAIRTIFIFKKKEKRKCNKTKSRTRR